ncbi:MAG: DUF2520 domain-containing protein [Dehalococcoidia bacterium]|nr:MAG: DUF2520 domain-containing protein [Dehalococcoidia bacterium]
MVKIGFIGAGTTGTALAVRLSQKGYPVLAVSSRSLVSAQRLAILVPNCEVYESAQEVADVSDLVFITTPDDIIARIAGETQWHAGQNVVHCSGAHSLDILEPARKLGANVGSFHPLQTFAGVNQAIDNLPGSAFALEAEEPLLSMLKELACVLDGSWAELKPGDKALYHAAAVFVSNYLVTLVKLALDLWQEFGVPPEEATKALLPLLKGTVNNIENIGFPNCLTGPVARGDLGTISKHLSVLNNRSSSLLSTYKELGLQAIPIALAKGKVDEKRAEELRTLLKI